MCAAFSFTGYGRVFDTKIAILETGVWRARCTKGNSIARSIIVHKADYKLKLGSRIFFISVTFFVGSNV